MKLSIVTGLPFEAKLLWPYRSDTLIVLSAGLTKDAARRTSQTAIEAGATALLSFGIAGGLDPVLKAGAAIIATEIRGPRAYKGDPGWAERMIACAGADLRLVPLAAAAHVIATPSDKTELFAATGAAAADMESYGIAEVAAERGLPFAALRVIADGANDTVPTVALRAMTADGRVRVGASIAGALLHPTQIPDLIRLGSRTAVATKVLAALARSLAPRLFGLV